MVGENELPKRSNLITHLCWTIGILLLAISYLMIGVRDGTMIRDFLSFSSSIASLILAVVAIFYSFISSQGLTNLVGSLRDSTSRVEQASETVSLSAIAIRDETRLLTGHVTEIPIAMRDLSERLEKQSRQTMAEAPAASTEEPRSAGLARLSNNTRGIQISLYLLIKSFETSQAFQPVKVFSEDFLGGYVAGVIHSIRATNFAGLEISKEGEVLECTSLGNLDIEFVKNASLRSKNKFVLSKVAEITKFFDSAEDQKDEAE